MREAAGNRIVDWVINWETDREGQMKTARGRISMVDSGQLNRALGKGEELAERLIIDFGFDRDEYEHDLFYGNPDAALVDIFRDRFESGGKVPKWAFDQALDVIEQVRGVSVSDRVRRKYGHLAQG